MRVRAGVCPKSCHNGTRLGRIRVLVCTAGGARVDGSTFETLTVQASNKAMGIHVQASTRPPSIQACLVVIN